MAWQQTQGTQPLVPFTVLHQASAGLEPGALAETAVRIAVVIPCYRVRAHILAVIGGIESYVSDIFVVDDCCPESSGDYVEAHCSDSRVRVCRHTQNQGVGGAVMTGCREALRNDATVVVKLDGDGQMDPKLIPRFVSPILNHQADYTKGNRFYNLDDVRSMPVSRLVGNATLSFLSKLSTGYWSIFDPTNGFTAIHANALRNLNLDKISSRFFFESDILFRLYLLNCLVVDIPMIAVYAGESSNLSIKAVMFEFFWAHVKNMLKRIFYTYFLRDFSVASIQLMAGSILLLFGVLFGAWSWYKSAAANLATPLGTIMLATLPIIVGVQLILAFLSYDVLNQPRSVMHPKLTP